MSILDTKKMEVVRIRCGLSQEDAARLAKLGGRQKWGDIVNGRRVNIKMDTLEAIASALQCDPRDLLVAPEKKPKKSKG